MSTDNDRQSLLATVAQAAVTAAAADPAAPAVTLAAAPTTSAEAAPATVAAAPPEGLTAASALELVATGYPAFAGKLNPLIALAKNGATEAAFSRAIVADLAAAPTTASTAAVDNKRENGQSPPKGGETKAEAAPDRSAVFAGRAEAMNGAR